MGKSIFNFDLNTEVSLPDKEANTFPTLTALQNPKSHGQRVAWDSAGILMGCGTGLRGQQRRGETKPCLAAQAAHGSHLGSRGGKVAGSKLA